MGEQVEPMRGPRHRVWGRGLGGAWGGCTQGAAPCPTPACCLETVMGPLLPLPTRGLSRGSVRVECDSCGHRGDNKDHDLAGKLERPFYSIRLCRLGL